MDTTSIIMVSCIGASMLIGSIGITFGMIVKVFKSGSSSGAPAGDENETRIIQEIYHGLTKMEDRIETLETLLVDGERKRSERQKLSDFDRDIERG
ncbi:TPA: phage-shock protein [Candidatus Poribacteria bacterium]|nr:phage-shock protein [Candidatus Poribacteria bacterium]